MSKIEVTLLHADWCGYCKDFMPKWDELVKSMQSNKNVALQKIEASDISFSQHGTINGEPVKGFPTIKIKIDGKELEYQGERSVDALRAYINTLVSKSKSGGNAGNMLKGGAKSKSATQKKRTRRAHKTHARRHGSTRHTKTIFSSEHYQSGDGMMTGVWGPSMWHVLHTMSFNYPTNPTPDDKRHFREFILMLKHVLPCKYCRDNLSKNLNKLPLTAKHLESRDAFSRYIYELHEIVNTMLGKKSELTYCDVRDRYEYFRARCLKNNNTTETGCTEPLWGTKSKCILHIVPKTKRAKMFSIDKKCIPKRVKY